MSMRTVRKNPLILAIVGVVVVAALAFAWWTISPLFIRTTLVEGQNINVPAVSSTDRNPTITEPTVAADTIVIAPVETKEEPAPETMPTEQITEKTDTMEQATVSPPMIPTAESIAIAAPTVTPQPAALNEPRVFANGYFDHKDTIHYADGQAILARDEEGNNIVRLQDLAAANGPDLYVYVTEHPDPSNSNELHMGGYNLGALKATNGSFSYVLDPAIDVSKIKAIVIYCKAFSVIFSTATLAIAEQ